MSVISAKKNAQSLLEIQEMKKKFAYCIFLMHVSVVSGLYKNSQNVYSRLFARVLERWRGYVAFSFRGSRLKAISR